MLLFASVAKVFACKMTSNENKTYVFIYKKHKDKSMDFWTSEAGSKEMQCIISTRYHPAVFSTSGTKVLGCTNKVTVPALLKVKPLDVAVLKGNDKLVCLYTGMPTYDSFVAFVEYLEPKSK